MKNFEDLKNEYELLAEECNKESSAVFFYLLHCSGMDQTQFYNNFQQTVTKYVLERFENGMKEYLYNNKPIQYLIGYQPFFGHDFICNESVLIPRFETEELVENVLFYYDQFFEGEKVDVCDIGTGSGCVGITLALEEQDMNVVITDISDEALKVARKNIKKLGANVEVLQGDMVKPLIGKKFDLIVSNPPYIPDEEEVSELVVKNEPNVALFGGSDGLDFYRIIVEDSSLIAKDKFMLAFEHSYMQNKEIKEIILNKYPSAKIEQIPDLQGKDRMTFAFIGDFDE